MCVCALGVGGGGEGNERERKAFQSRLTVVKTHTHARTHARTHACAVCAATGATGVYGSAQKSHLDVLEVMINAHADVNLVSHVAEVFKVST